MDFTAKRGEIEASIEHVINACGDGISVPIMANVLLQVDEPQSLRLTGTDCIVELRTPCSIEHIDGSGAFTVSARKLRQIARLTPSADLRISHCTTDSTVTITAGRSRYRLRTLPADNFPVPIELKERSLATSVPARDLRQCAAQARVAMDRRRDHAPYGGMLLDVSGNGLSCIATDQHRLAVSQCRVTGTGAQRAQAILARRGVDTLISALASAEPDEQVTLRISSYYLQVRLHTVTASFALVAGPYADYKAAIPGPLPYRMSVSRTVLLGTAERAQILAPDGARWVHLVASPGQCTLQVLDKMGNPAEPVILSETIHARGNPWPSAIALNTDHLVDALSVLTGDDAVLHVGNPDDGIRIEAIRDHTSMQILAPQRVA